MSTFPLSKRARMWVKRMFMMRANRWYYNNFRRGEFNENGVDIFEEDWDNLLILDACRYDTFEKLHDLPGSLSKRESRASTTPEFIRANIHGRDLRDTIYITATPQIHNHDDVNQSFNEIVDVWETEWDEDLGTVQPGAVGKKKTLETQERFPNKRLLVHFLQPHYPFIGEVGEAHFNYDEVNIGGRESSAGGSEKFWDTVGTEINDVPEDIVWEAYEENLEETLPHVKNLLLELGGKTVVTADHGEMIYDYAWPIPVVVNGHPGGLYTPELVEIPWHTYTNGSRRQITASTKEGDKTEKIDEDVIETRLQDLGYA